LRGVARAQNAASDSPQTNRTAAQLQELVVPYAGVPAEALVVIFDAARFPSDITEAARGLKKPEAERGKQPDTQESVCRLTQKAPQVVAFMSSNTAATASLGSAYQEQPADLWRAYDEMTLRLRAQQAGAGHDWGRPGAPRAELRRGRGRANQGGVPRSACRAAAARSAAA
jgi:hypothetical protein